MNDQDPDLECRHVVELITDYLEGALPTENTAQLEQHFLICDACMTYLDQHRSVVRTLSQLAERPGSAQSAAPESARSAALKLFRLHRAAEPGTDER